MTTSSDTTVFVHMQEGPIAEGGPSELPGWYFWDEVEFYHGPFATREAAREALKSYCEVTVALINFLQPGSDEGEL